MMRLRHTATMFFGLLLAGFLAFEAVEAAGALQGETFNLAFDFDSEESEEGQEEEREGPEENKDKTSENVAFLNGERLRLAAERQRMHRAATSQRVGFHGGCQDLGTSGMGVT